MQALMDSPLHSQLGKSNPLVKRIRALRRDADLRDREQLFVAEGLHLVQEALASGAEIERLLFSARLLRYPEGRGLLDGAASNGIATHELDGRLLDSLQDAQTAQPVMALVRRACVEEPEVSTLEVVADGIQDPGNLGGIVRTADAAGADRFHVTARSADPFHPRAIRATAGSVFRLVPSRDDDAKILKGLRSRGLRLIGAAPGTATPLSAVDLTLPLALCFGSEGSGLSPGWDEALDERISIPMRRGVESLSVAAAAAVLLFECVRQRSLR